jgi:hypothetical protein
VIRTEPATGSDAALVSGLIGPAFVAARGGAGVGLVLEFGTRPMHDVMLAVLADNWLQHYGDRGSERGRTIERQMREAFFVDDDAWKEKVCLRAREVLERGIPGIAESQP